MTDTLPALREAEFQATLIEAAELLGWHWVHFRPAQTRRGWRTPVSGPLGAGWVDLFLAHPRDRRLLAIECKRVGRRPTREQAAVHDVLRSAGLDVRVWSDADWPEIEAVLRSVPFHPVRLP